MQRVTRILLTRQSSLNRTDKFYLKVEYHGSNPNYRIGWRVKYWIQIFHSASSSIPINHGNNFIRLKPWNSIIVNPALNITNKFFSLISLSNLEITEKLSLSKLFANHQKIDLLTSWPWQRRCWSNIVKWTVFSNVILYPTQ